MKQITKTAVSAALASVLTIALLPLPAGAQWAVFDASSFTALGHIWNQDISTYAKLVQEYNQLIKIYTTGANLYQNAMAMSQSFRRGQRMNWVTMATTGFGDYTRNRYGETVLWPQMVNGHPSLAPQAWTAASLQYQPNGALNLSTANLSRILLARLASMEALDGSATKCLQNAGEYRQTAQNNAVSFFHFQTDQQNDHPLFNSMVQQLNLMNGAHSQQINEQRSQGQLKACEVEQQAIQAKIQRDQIAEEMSIYQDEQSSVTNNYSGLSDPTPTANTWMPN